MAGLLISILNARDGDDLWRLVVGAIEGERRAAERRLLTGTDSEAAERQSDICSGLRHPTQHDPKGVNEFTIFKDERAGISVQIPNIRTRSQRNENDICDFIIEDFNVHAEGCEVIISTAILRTSSLSDLVLNLEVLATFSDGILGSLDVDGLGDEPVIAVEEERRAIHGEAIGRIGAQVDTLGTSAAEFFTRVNLRGGNADGLLGSTGQNYGVAGDEVVFQHVRSVWIDSLKQGKRATSLDDHYAGFIIIRDLN